MSPHTLKGYTRFNENAVDRHQYSNDAVSHVGTATAEISVPDWLQDDCIFHIPTPRYRSGLA